jgi:hypothetical protein
MTASEVRLLLKTSTKRKRKISKKTCLLVVVVTMTTLIANMSNKSRTETKDNNETPIPMGQDCKREHCDD